MVMEPYWVDAKNTGHAVQGAQAVFRDKISPISQRRKPSNHIL